MCILVIALFTLPHYVVAEESVYDALVEIKEMDSIYSYKIEDKKANRLERRSPQHHTIGQPDNRFFGWVKADEEPRTRIQITGAYTSSSQESQSEGLIVAKYTGPDLGPNDLPYIDAEGFTNNNYSILLTASWCKWCHKMYKDTVESLREKGFKVFVIDVDEFPDIKDRIYRRDPTAEKLGFRGVPYFIIREDGKTKKIFYGYTTPEVIIPYLKKPVKPETVDDPYDLR